MTSRSVFAVLECLRADIEALSEILTPFVAGATMARPGNAQAAKRPKRKATPTQILQGRYLAALMRVPKTKRAAVKKVLDTKGKQAAIEVAISLAKR